MNRKILGCIVLIGLTACHKKGSSSSSPIAEIPSQEIALVAGAYNGNYTVTNLLNTDLHVTLTQDGIHFSGTYAGNKGALIGSVTGTIGINTVTFAATDTSPCTGTYTGSATLSDKTMTGTYTGSDCNGPEAGTFSITR
jgi:hypothetical protein